MDIISKIEIKHFRSFDGGKDQPKVKIDDLKDFNIFSGSNDSGKSNVLRALNLFFNDEISPGLKFDKDRDFSKIVANRFDKDIEERKNTEAERIRIINEEGKNEKPKDLRRSDEVISIKLFFNNKKKQRGLPESFWISKTFSQKNNFQGEFNYQGDLNKAQTTAFLKSFQYEYIPAIKDRNFFNYLFGKLQNYLFEKGDKSKRNQFKESSGKFNDILRSETGELFDKFFHSSGVTASFYIPSTLVDFFRTLSVQTENNISLFDRGDGVQARFIPEILDEISKGTNKNIIWGFEEPENSYEAKNIRKLKDEFQFNYSRKYQIFITTHTKEFLATKRAYSAKEFEIIDNRKLNTQQKKHEAIAKLGIEHISSDIAIYRVWKNETTDYTSLVTRYDENNSTWEDICDDLGIIQEARIIDDLQSRIDIQIKDIQNSKLTIRQQKSVYKELETEYINCLDKLNGAESKIEEYLKPILLVEDKYDSIYKIAFLKLQDFEFTKNNIDDVFKQNAPFVIRRAESAGAVAGKLSMNNTDGYEDKKIIGLFDFDKEGSEKFYFLKKQNNWDDTIKGDTKSGYFKKRNQHDCFYALLLPIPDRLQNIVGNIASGDFTSFVEIENLLPESVLIAKKLVDQKTVLSIKYNKIKENVKSKALDSFIDLPKEDFNDFIPLFDKIVKLFAH